MRFAPKGYLPDVGPSVPFTPRDDGDDRMPGDGRKGLAAEAELARSVLARAVRFADERDAVRANSVTVVGHRARVPAEVGGDSDLRGGSIKGVLEELREDSGEGGDCEGAEDLGSHRRWERDDLGC